MRQLGDVGERENFDFDPTFLKNEIPPLELLKEKVGHKQKFLASVSTNLLQVLLEV